MKQKKEVIFEAFNEKEMDRRRRISKSTGQTTKRNPEEGRILTAEIDRIQKKKRNCHKRRGRNERNRQVGQRE
jgi:hypothetical protein